MRIVITLILAIFLLESCAKTEQECFAPRSVSAQVGFMVIDTMVKLDSLSRPDTTIRIADTGMFYPTLTSLDMDSNIIFQGDRDVSRLLLFLNPDTTSIRYILKTNRDSAVVDTITIDYEPYNHFISNSCGYTYYYNIKNVHSTNYWVDSVRINQADVTASAQQRHLILYFFD